MGCVVVVVGEGEGQVKYKERNNRTPKRSGEECIKQQKPDIEFYWTKIKVSAWLCDFLETVEKNLFLCIFQLYRLPHTLACGQS